MSTNKNAPISNDGIRIIEARHHDPFSYLGKHSEGGDQIIRAFIPHTSSAKIIDSNIELKRVGNSDLFEWKGQSDKIKNRYQIEICNGTGHKKSFFDPYCFPPQISDYDIHLFGEGKHQHAYRLLGSHEIDVDGVKGVLFATWAPSAERVSVIGNFNQWDGRIHPMRIRGGSGIWELFIPGLRSGELYKFEILNRASREILEKADPYGQQFEIRPKTSTVVAKKSEFKWEDDGWLEHRKQTNWLHQPMSIYEVHPGSWQFDEHRQPFNYRELAHRLVDYVKELGFTHIELLPVTEHPLDASWGYQTVGYFSPTSRFGSPDDFRYFMNYCHQNNIGVILDWVPGHYPKDAHGLAFFDGSALYEHEDPRLGEHQDWGTLIFNYGRNEVRNFLISSALYWIEEFHLDGLRVDAVASMLYLDYSREHDQWVPNIHGGNENLEAISFIRELNELTHSQFPGTIIAAEESTSWPMVSRPVWLGGLGYTMKWNMGWMNDTLEYMSKDPIHRHYHHDMLTFSQLYAFTENFILPFSHDEVVHGKQSLLNKMPGDEWQKFANLRLLYAYMFAHPGKKLLFMGCEFAQGSEWNNEDDLDWHLLDYPFHRGIQLLVKDLNHLYQSTPALHQLDFDPTGFEWIDCNDASQSVLTFLRRFEDKVLIVAINFTPIPRYNYRIGVPGEGLYKEMINTDSEFYAGSNLGNSGMLQTEPMRWMNRPHSMTVTLPPLACVIFEPFQG